MSKMHFKYGAMDSGKSDTLIKHAFNYEAQGLRIVTIKPAKDTKGDRSIVSRAGFKRPADILATPEVNLRAEVAQLNKKNKIHCVMVDEAQFLEPAQISQLHAVAKQDNISVIAFGLRTDFLGKLFPGSQRLLELVDNIEKLPAMCRCGSQAEFNARKVNDKYVFQGSQVAIDGEAKVSYDSLCGSCYVQEGGTI